MSARPQNYPHLRARRLRRLSLERLESRRVLSITVDTLLDELDGSITDGDISLRDAIAAAPAGETIDFSVSGAIDLSMGELELTRPLTIDGPGAETLTVDAQQNSRIFNITSTSGDFTIAGLTLTGGQTTGDNAGIDDNTYNGGAIRSVTSGNLQILHNVVSGNSTPGFFAFGGGLFAVGATTIDDTTVSYNTADFIGGGVAARGPLTITDSSLQGNITVAATGGGVWAVDELTVSQSLVSGNTANVQGGGIYSTGPLTITDSTISDNSVYSQGGGVHFWAGHGLGNPAHTDAQATIIGSTISGNVSSFVNGGGGFWGLGASLTVVDSTISGNANVGNGGGGGIKFQHGVLTILNSTISDNSAGYNGGVISINDFLTISGSIIAGNSASSGSDDLGTVGPFRVEYSLIGDAGVSITGPGNILNQNPMLAPLADNGGPTQTHALLPGSPALDAGDLDFMAPPYFDQRGAPFVRVYNDRIDIGSFESQPVMPDGDFNDDGLYDCLDIDALVAEIAAGNHVGSFDMTGDGFVDLADRDAWLAEAGAINLGPGKLYLLGDANLDGFVDGLDFVEWNENKFTFLAAWCGGDFTADGIVDGLDYIEWNTNKFQSSDGVSEIVSPRLSSDPHEITSPNQVYNDTDVDRLSVTPRLAPLAAKMVDSVFATSRRSEDHKNERQRADSFANLGALAINPYLF